MRADRLDRETSAEIVKELIAVLGNDRAAEILDVGAARFKTLAGERGCLTHPQLQRITDSTGKAWQFWGVDAGARHAKSPEAVAFVARARAMWEEILGKPASRPANRPARRGRTSGLRQAV